MNPLRRELLDYEPGPPELGPEGSFLAARQAALAILFLDHTELYRRLYRRYERDGRSDELDAIALDAAGNLATVLQTLRARQDLVTGLAVHEEFCAIPIPAIDQLLYSFLLIADLGEDGYTIDACLSGDEASCLLKTDGVVAWLRELNADIVMSDLSASRFAGLDDYELG